MTSPIGIFGGTFDPIHFGHLRIALELLERLKLSHVRFVPCRTPAHRMLPSANETHRWEMLKAAIAPMTEFIADDIEMRREGPSYMIDTLRTLRLQFPDQPLCLLVGMDAFIGMSTWHHFEKLIDVAHIVVVERPGYFLPNIPALQNLLAKHEVDNPQALRDQQAGCVFRIEHLTQLAISATHIRTLIRTQRNAHFLLPTTVIDYIQTHQLYRGEHA